MNDDQQKNETEEKKPYSKPALRQVPLRPDEAVLGFCKSVTASGPAAATCNTLACSSLGS